MMKKYLFETIVECQESKHSFALMGKGEKIMRLIDADDLAAKIMMEAPDFMDGGSSITKAFILAMIKTKSVTPTIDAVPTVLCKACKHQHEYRTGSCPYYTTYGSIPPDDWFCADGNRR